MIVENLSRLAGSLYFITQIKYVALGSIVELPFHSVKFFSPTTLKRYCGWVYCPSYIIALMPQIAIPIYCCFFGIVCVDHQNAHKVAYDLYVSCFDLI